jgi:hypothetical protein
MGPKHSQEKEASDYTLKLQRSEFLISRRRQKKKVLSSMFKRVLTSNTPARPPDLANLPENAILLIMEYVPNDTKSILLVSALWYCKICEVIDHAFNSIESGFAIMHSHLINFKKSFLYLKDIKANGKKGLRVDRVLVAEILPILRNHTVKIRYNYKYYRSSLSYTAEFKIDCIEKGKRSLWCHRDESRFHGTDIVRAYTSQISKVCIGDNIEFAINWYSLYGLLRLESIAWQPPIITSFKSYLKSLQSFTPDQEELLNKKTHLYKVSRECEPEVNSSEWYDNKYYPAPPQAVPYDIFLPFLRLIKFEYTGSEIIVSKSTYRAETIGIVPDSVTCIGICIEIIDSTEVKQEVKRMGLLYDRHIPIKLRIGDELLVYISRGG